MMIYFFTWAAYGDSLGLNRDLIDGDSMRFNRISWPFNGDGMGI